MKNKTANLITKLSVAGIMCLSMGTAVADSKRNVADINNDGMVDSQELVSYVQMNFVKIDKNSGSKLSAREVAELEEIFDIDG